jgi:hypothetical protein
MGLTLALSGCASQGGTVSCADISGTYRNASDTQQLSLASVLAIAQPGARTIAITRDGATQDWVVVANRERHVLKRGDDYMCAQDGIELVKTVDTASALPPLASTKEAMRYTLQKMPDGSLVAHRSAQTSAVAYGIPLTGPAHEEPDITWQPAN